MANKKINDLAAAGAVSDTMQYETDIGGITPNKVTSVQLGDYINTVKTYSGLTTFNKTLQSALNELNTYQNKIEKDISYFLNTAPTQTLATVGAGDLATKIATLVDGDILEIQTSASYSSITIPAGVRFAIRVAEGYDVELNGAQGVTLNDGAADVFLSGFIFDSNPSGSNSKGSAICFQHEAIVNDITFHNCSLRNNDTSAVVLSYHQAIGGDNYTVPNTPSEFSDRIAFVDCHFHKAADEPIEGGAVVMRGINLGYIYDCQFNGQDLCRQINVVNSLNLWVVNNKITRAGGGGNGEGIKIDKLGSPTYDNSGYFIGNHVTNCIEGIDIDDTVSAFVLNNKVSGCSAEGLSLDDSSRGVFIGNISYNNNDGIRFEASSVGQLKQNYCYNNTNQNYRMDNGFTPDDSNSTSIQDSMIGADIIPYDNSSIGFTSTLVQDAIVELKNYTDEIAGGNSLEYYLSDTIDGVIATYNLMYPEDTGEAESTVNNTITGSDILIKSFITETGEPGAITLIQGVYEGHIHAAKTAGTKDVFIYWKLFKRDNVGTETLLVISENSSILTGSNTSYNLHGSLPSDTSLLSTDRLVIKYYGTQSGVGTDPQATLYLEGTNDSRIEIRTDISGFDARYVRKDPPADQTINKSLILNNALLVDDINELTGANGVNIQGVNIDESGANAFFISRGTTDFLVNTTCLIDQNLQTTALVTHSRVTGTARVDTPRLRATTSAGLRLEDDGGNLGLFVKDGGFVGINTDNPIRVFEIVAPAAAGANVDAMYFRNNATSQDQNTVSIIFSTNSASTTGQGAIRCRQDSTTGGELLFGTWLSGAGTTNWMIIDKFGKTAIGSSLTPSQDILRLEQSNNSGNVSPLRLDQEDTNAGFFDLQSTGTVDRGPIATSTTDSLGSWRIEIKGVYRTVAFYADQ